MIYYYFGAPYLRSRIGMPIYTFSCVRARRRYYIQSTSKVDSWHLPLPVKCINTYDIILCDYISDIYQNKKCGLPGDKWLILWLYTFFQLCVNWWDVTSNLDRPCCELAAWASDRPRDIILRDGRPGIHTYTARHSRPHARATPLGTHIPLAGASSQ